ncbi:MAG: hypothetical protein AN481_06215 [Aphanizomenon flos-aquae LD13]|jgi:hypothetical protein|uniref:Uncharacterized protein n=1 Tax=Aphanizomenon flos-aquae LD13 TaxID=1710894 RepID=A0A1B7VYY4_APHFL|nr:hypothetical protein [Aphanizomenon flos-aquae UKL13-PB]OBQ26206.1 MAG: hypothetical protein AN481_06215 [Aphanizomenon flos-aquae LD13]HCQ20567.1 hypothetical protein [Anabaena sp. UBA12330]
MTQTTPLEVFINWYTNLPLDIQNEFALAVMTYVPNFVNEENSLHTVSISDASQIFHNFKNCLESYKTKEKAKVVGLLLCLRSIISFHAQKCDMPFDEQLSTTMNIYTSAFQEVKKKKNLDEKEAEEEAKKMINLISSGISSKISASIEIKKSWDELCKKDLSDEQLHYSLFPNSSDSV